jgi:uncharacterized 2Fe-2S/4Fe-4S cluster protein (DUF4445 family)
VCAEGGVDRRTTFSTCTFVGNPIMHHLLPRHRPDELGQAPFALATDRRRADLGA